MRKSVVCVVLFVAVIAQAARQIPDDNLAYPVLLTLKTDSKTFTGTAFYLRMTNRIVLVTARHVLFEPGVQTNKRPSIQTEEHEREFSILRQRCGEI